MIERLFIRWSIVDFTGSPSTGSKAPIPVTIAEIQKRAVNPFAFENP
jgi:hypothetical protein